MSFHLTTMPQNLVDDDQPHASNKTPQNTVTCVYLTQIGGYWRNVTVFWAKNTNTHSLNIYIDSMGSELHPNCKIDLKPWYFWAKKGSKTIQVDGYQIEVYWDFRSAKFLGSPEPCSDFYVALIYEEEVVFLIGDLKQKVYKKMKTRPAEVEGLLFFKKEHVFGKKSFVTRAKFDPNRKDCEIVVESSMLGSKDPEMWISIDGIVLIHVKNLQWKFRGNQIVFINKQPIEVFWDVHTWLFLEPGSDHGLFIFKHGQQDSDSDRDDDKHSGTGDSDCSVGSRYYSAYGTSTNSQLCLFLYAWKME
ncbi:hypothetical protein L6452_19293 [Arctium lappa]|uniref:Uncharacterized protein n=1 Tax=Arctium lappa TaxID=4217 RepID=A0ACB9B8P8_ARCLA|nr:hypothetical protein L6452_19293 [Arctium lappa]